MLWQASIPIFIFNKWTPYRWIYTRSWIVVQVKSTTRKGSVQNRNKLNMIKNMWVKQNAVLKSWRVARRAILFCRVLDVLEFILILMCLNKGFIVAKPCFQRIFSIKVITNKTQLTIAPFIFMICVWYCVNYQQLVLVSGEYFFWTLNVFCRWPLYWPGHV